MFGPQGPQPRGKPAQPILTTQWRAATGSRVVPDSASLKSQLRSPHGRATVLACSSVISLFSLELPL